MDDAEKKRTVIISTSQQSTAALCTRAAGRAMEPSLKEVQVGHKAEENGHNSVVVDESPKLWFKFSLAIPVDLRGKRVRMVVG